MDMASIADEQGLTLYIEPAPLEKGKGSISRDSLVGFYLSCGFCRTSSGSDRVLVRHFSRERYPQLWITRLETVYPPVTRTFFGLPNF